MSAWLEIGQAAYVAFAAHAARERGVVMVGWGKLGDESRACWAVAGKAAVEEAVRIEARAKAERVL